MNIPVCVLVLFLVVISSVHSTGQAVNKSDNHSSNNVTGVAGRIHRIRPYRIQRRIQEESTNNYYSDEDKSEENREEGDDDKRRPRRKLLIYKTPGYQTATTTVTKSPSRKGGGVDSRLDELNRLFIPSRSTGGITEKKKKIIDNSLEANDVNAKSNKRYGNLLIRERLQPQHHQPELRYRPELNQYDQHHPHHRHHHQQPLQHPGSGPPPGAPVPYAVDPASPIVQAHMQHNPLAPLHPHLASSSGDHDKKKKNALTYLLPLDPTLFAVGLVIGWLFWAGVFYAYSYWGDNSLEPLMNLPMFMKNSQLLNHNKMDKFVVEANGNANNNNNINSNILQQFKWGLNNAANQNHQSNPGAQVQTHPKPIIVKIEPGKPPQFFQTARAMSGGNGFSFARVLDMIAMAQETYERFDFQSLDCQKKALCELQQKQAEFGETGRKISSTFTFFDALQDLPMPAIIQTYLKEYKEAILQGKNSSKDCALIYPKCDFSLKEVFVKYSKKSTKMNKDKEA